MSMIGNYRRISRAELQDLLADPSRLSAVLYPEGDEDPARYLDIDKAWHIIHFLLTGTTYEGQWPLVAVVMGGTEISDEDVGYGPARYLDGDDLAEVAAALDSVSADELWSRFDVDAVCQAEIYPQAWTGDSGDRDYVTTHYRELQDFLRKAAGSGDAVILYLN